MIPRAIDWGREQLETLEYLAVNEPLMFIGILISVIVLSIILYFLYKRLTRTRSDKLQYILSSHPKVTILMHENPDPDAMASALGTKRLADEVDTKVNIRYAGRIGHHENRAFRAVLDLKFESIESANEIDEDEEVIVVDHQSPRGFDGCETINPIAVIDHHEDRYTGDSPYVHIEPNIGSCSTLITEYFSEQGLTFHSDDEDDGNPDINPTLATALYYGIMTDTTNLTQNVNERDYKAAMTLYRSVDSEKLHRISTPKIDGESLEVKANAIYSKEIEGSFSVSDVGEVTNPDSIPQAADELVRQEGISAVVVMGEYNDVIRFSGRAYDDRVHMGAALETAIDDIEGAGAGGHTKMGGGQITKEQLTENGITKDELKERFFRVLKGEH